MSEVVVSPNLTVEAVAARMAARSTANRVVFSVKALHGLSPRSIRMPLNEYESIESGQISVSLDPDADPSLNIGIVDFDRLKLRVRYGAQLIFPGLIKLITEGRHDPGLLHPVRGFAQDDCTVTPDLQGWHALGTMEFLPGSLWAGASGG
jgi:hypothetical protein